MSIAVPSFIVAWVVDTPTARKETLKLSVLDGLYAALDRIMYVLPCMLPLNFVSDASVRPL